MHLIEVKENNMQCIAHSRALIFVVIMLPFLLNLSFT